MSVMIETSLGEVVVDLFCDEAPLATKNFLKLCKVKYYNGCLFYNVQQNFMIQTGDPTATGKGGTSVYGLMYGEQARFFEDEIRPTSRKHDEAGLVSMANMGVPDSNGSQFFFCMRGDDMQHLDGKHSVFAKVMEGMETLEQINEQFCDDAGRPYRDIRILHTYVLDDPFDDPPQLVEPDESPLRDRPEEERIPLRLGALDKVSLEQDEQTEIEREKELREKTARSNAVVLEMIGDLPDADMKPPENVLFVCKLNPVTTDDDLEIIFTRFGPCRAEICRDHITGDSLNYAFVEFEAVESCEEAFKKMNNVLIDDRRIRVDFSQSVSKEWSKYKSRAQGGQKLKSGKGGKSVQQQHHNQQESSASQKGQTTASAGANGDRRRSKWGNAPTPTGVTITVADSDKNMKRGGNESQNHRIRHDNGHEDGNRGRKAHGKNGGGGAREERNGYHCRNGGRGDGERGMEGHRRRDREYGRAEDGIKRDQKRPGGVSERLSGGESSAGRRNGGRDRDEGDRVKHGGEGGGEGRDARDQDGRRDSSRYDGGGRRGGNNDDRNSKRPRRDDSRDRRDVDSRRTRENRDGGRSKEDDKRGHGRDSGRRGGERDRRDSGRNRSRSRSRDREHRR